MGVRAATTVQTRCYRVNLANSLGVCRYSAAGRM
jgi:hypothetical protein